MLKDLEIKPEVTQKFRHGDVNDLAYRRALVDTFVSKIYLFYDKLVIICNAGETNKIEVPLDKLCGSPKGKMECLDKINAQMYEQNDLT